MKTEKNIPKHLGLILDGNRRWAKEKGKPTFAGHKAGFENLSIISEYARSLGIGFVSAFVFSTENWSRTKKEVDYLMNLGITMIGRETKKAVKNGVRIIAVGDLKDPRIPKKLLDRLREAEEKTKTGNKGTLALCFNYGGHREIVYAVKNIVAKGLKAEEINEETIANNLYHPEIPPIDLLIRTSGEHRLSNFMLWRVSYAELYFVDKHWPAFTAADLDAAIDDFTNRHRRFGGN